MRRLLVFLFFSTIAIASHAQQVDSTLYKESGITLHTSTGKIFGTLCVPTGATHVSVALIVAGSGPTDRDGNNIMGVNCDAYKILAHRLAANHIASLRYDKRGVGESSNAMTSESDLRFKTYIDDACDWVDSLKRSKEFTSVIVIGHSEGSLVGMVAAQGADKYVSIAGVGTRIDMLLKRQLASIPASTRDSAYTVLDSLAGGHLVSGAPTQLRSMFRKSVQPYMISWMRYSPQEEISKLHIPVLLIQGTNDIQVDTGEARMLFNAKPSAKLIFVGNMNHLFRTVVGDRAENLKTYSEPDLPISDELVNAVTEFIKPG